MSTQSSVSILAVLLSYQKGLLTARNMIARVDELVANDLVSFSDPALVNAFEELHRSMALCVWDDETYSAAPTAYIRESDLKQKIDDFVRDWGELLASKM